MEIYEDKMGQSVDRILSSHIAILVAISFSGSGGGGGVAILVEDIMRNISVKLL